MPMDIGGYLESVYLKHSLNLVLVFKLGVGVVKVSSIKTSVYVCAIIHFHALLFRSKKASQGRGRWSVKRMMLKVLICL